MSKKSFPRPAGHHSITPMAVVTNAHEVLAFVQNAFGGEVVDKLETPDGHLVHAETLVGDAVLMLGAPFPGTEAMPVALYHYVKDADAVDATYKKALKAGATSESEPTDQFWGYRTAGVVDAGGNRWTISTIIEEVSSEEIAKRMASASQ